MTKREILIQSIIAKKRNELKCLGDEELLQKVGDYFFCHECPLCGELCDKYEEDTCTKTIKAWFYEGGGNGNNN